jgi:hypothetical protein
VLSGLVVTGLRVLQERHQQEGDDRGRGVDDERQVSRLKIPIDGAQITISKTQPAKNGARLAKLDAAPAKRSKKPTRPVTELGMVPDSTAAFSFVMTAT